MGEGRGLTALVVLGLSIVLQAVAAGLALLLVRITRQTLAWSLIAAALVLMAVRRGHTLYAVAVLGMPVRFDPAAEYIALTISAFFALGMLTIASFLLTLQKRQEKLREKEIALSDAQQIAGVGNWEWNIPSNEVWWSDEHFRIFGYEPGEFVPSHLSFLDRVHPEDQEFAKRTIDAAIAAGQQYEIDFRIVLPNGDTRILHGRGAAISGRSGKRERMYGTVQDITETRRAEIMAMRLGRIVEDSVNEIYVFDAETLCFLDVNRGARQNLGYSTNELRKLTPVDIKPEFTRESFEALIQPLLNEERKLLTFQTVHRRKDGTTYDVEVRLQLSRTESPPVFVAIIQDITERLAVEEQLRQAQKMEAVGQLTGGVAHDFNNLLAVILGNLEVLEEKLPADTSVRELLRSAVRAVERGALLTGRLLAFSRKQNLNPCVVNLNGAVSGMAELLGRALGGNVTVEAVPVADLWPCEVDPAQLENAILNLAINARDAMPDGGKLTIETANVEINDEYAAAQADVAPGNYVVVIISDTGVGMPPEVLKRVFEPFYSTKEPGKGTGLGLSMVYGFVKQSGGHVTIYSEVGRGTTVRLYLPRAHGTESARPIAEPAMDDFQARGEAVLVVEDDADVRTLATILLKDFGYEVLEAEGAAAALEILAGTTRINLLLTDMVLPGRVTGTILAAEARKLRPGLKVLFMSGYTEKAAAGGGPLGPTDILLQKPFHRLEFARKVRQALATEHPS